MNWAWGLRLNNAKLNLVLPENPTFPHDRSTVLKTSVLQVIAFHLDVFFARRFFKTVTKRKAMEPATRQQKLK